MEFSNKTIDTAALPRFEDVVMTPLHPDYWKVTLLFLGAVIFLVVIGLGAALYTTPELAAFEMQLITGTFVLLILVIFFARLSFRKKAFAFREHDVLFRSGIIATSTIVIPYNRVQHVALHEGLISRMFGLAKIELFTAGGKSSDIEIPGIKKAQAESIKHLLMGKIRKEL